MKFMKLKTRGSVTRYINPEHIFTITPEVYGDPDLTSIVTVAGYDIIVEGEFQQILKMLEGEKE
jgi:hypothetical protein